MGSEGGCCEEDHVRSVAVIHEGRKYMKHGRVIGDDASNCIVRATAPYAGPVDT